MPSFPLMRDLPTVVETTGWDWRPYAATVAPSMNFWLGTDCQGGRWLTKLRGDFYAYREIVFARLAQQMGWSCQSSVFMRLDEYGAKAIGAEPGQIHAAHWFMDEHVVPPCSRDCNLASLQGRQVGTVEDIADLSIDHILDWPKSELAACLFGGYEPPGRLFTKEHEFVIIDSELMFASGPCSFDSTPWWGDRGAPTPCGVNLAQVVCADFLALGQQSLKMALAIPACIQVQEMWPIKPLLDKSYAHARAFICRARGETCRPTGVSRVQHVQPFIDSAQ